MKKIAKTALVFHSAEKMFDLVDNVPDYPSFLPWCADATVKQQDEDTMIAELSLAKGKLRHAFTTKNLRVRPERIELGLVEGPFKHFHGEWRFEAKGDDACQVSLELSFDMGGKLTALALGPVFTQVANTMVQAFCDRADQVYT